MFYLAKTPRIIQAIFPHYTWSVPTSTKTVYLTFDDGPIPVVTPWVLDVLKQYNAKATFFCVGDNVKRHPDVYSRVLLENHSVGNHTFHHLNGFKTDLTTYVQDTSDCAQLVESDLFRPPYGRLTRAQRKALPDSYRIILWDVLSADFVPNITPERCLQNMIKNISPGSIVLMHDSMKTFDKIKYALPLLLDFLRDEGYECAGL